MFQRLLFAVCALLTVTSLHGQKWQNHYKRAVRQLASDDEVDFQCLVTLITLGDDCGENPFEDPNFGERFVVNDLGEVCSSITPWFECVKRSVTSNCGGSINNPLLDDIKRLFAAAEVTINYVCIQHVDVLNRKKVCVLVQGPEVQASCEHLIQENFDNPLCIINAPLRACVTNIIAKQCGQEVATTLEGLVDSYLAAAECPARRMVMKSLPAALQKQRGLPFHKTA